MKRTWSTSGLHSLIREWWVALGCCWVEWANVRAKELMLEVGFTLYQSKLSLLYVELKRNLSLGDENADWT